MTKHSDCWLFFNSPAAAAAMSLQSCPTLCDPIDGSSPGSPVPGILQARTLERIAISFSNAWGWKVKVKSLSGVRLLSTPWTAAHQAPPPMGFSGQEYWSGVPLPLRSTVLKGNKGWQKSFDIGRLWDARSGSNRMYYLEHFPSYVCKELKFWAVIWSRSYLAGGIAESWIQV